MRELRSGLLHEFESAADPWTLRNDPLFSSAGPCAVLTVRPRVVPDLPPSLQLDFGVEEIDARPSHEHHFRLTRIVDGEHKIQALTLFGFGAVLLHIDPSLALFLHEARRLHALLEARLVHQSLTPPEYWRQDLGEWTPLPGCLALDVPTQLHLALAGMLTRTSPAIRYLSRRAIQWKLNPGRRPALRRVAAAAQAA